MITKPGIYYDIDPTAYLEDPCPEPSLTQSIAKILIEQSPAHARLAHPRLAPPAEVDEVEKYVSARVIGDAAHTAMIGRGKRLAVADFDSWRTKDAQAFRADAEAAGQLAILAKHAERAREMVKAASFQLEAAGHRHAFRLGSGEVVLAWQEGCVWFRTMIDWLVDTTRIYDFKTSGMSCAPHAVVDRPSLEGWDIQAAMHERGLDILDPDNAGRRKHFFVAQENEPPYALTVVEISEHDLHMGRRKLEAAASIWRRCVESGVWPLYPPQTITSRPRAWTETQWLEREVEDDARRLDELARRKDEGEPLGGHARAVHNILQAG